MGWLVLVSLFWSMRADLVPAWRKKGLDAWKDDVRALFRRAVDELVAARPVLAMVGAGEVSRARLARHREAILTRWS